MTPQYLHLIPGALPPTLAIDQFCGAIVSEISVEQEWRDRVAAWLVRSGCLYAVAWGT
ncbi:MAG: hypothetical protein JNJ92_02940 [Altererythrobacter sp.]|nr:hypothetical protein [Altererythrobacter sp.]